MRSLIALCLIVASVAASGRDVPGGYLTNAERRDLYAYEMVLSPTVMLSPSGAYLSSQVRYQAFDRVGTGFGFGAGELGFNFGGNAIWYLELDKDLPHLALLGGLYFNRVENSNYLVVRMVPTVSQEISFTWGKVTPYGALQVAPSIGLGTMGSFGVRADAGTKFTFKELPSLQFWTELGVGVSRAASQVAVGISYPFAD